MADLLRQLDQGELLVIKSEDLGVHTIRIDDETTMHIECLDAKVSFLLDFENLLPGFYRINIQTMMVSILHYHQFIRRHLGDAVEWKWRYVSYLLGDFLLLRVLSELVSETTILQLVHAYVRGHTT